MNAAMPIDPLLLLCALLLVAYTAFVASEFRLDTSTALRWFSLRGARIGGSLAVGTGLWATGLLGLLSMHHMVAVADAVPFALLAWLLAVAASSALLHAAARWRQGLLKAAPGLAAGATALSMMHVALDGLNGVQMVRHLDLDHVAVLAAGSLCFAMAMASALQRHGDVALSRFSAGRIALILLLGALAIGPTVQAALQGEPAPQPAAGASAFELPAVLLALLAALGSTLVLTMARLTLRMEHELRGRAQDLSASLQAANQNLRKLAYRDPLTRLANRLMFDHKLAAAVAAADKDSSRLTLLYVDLDGFKPVNDFHGHAIGDQVLCAVGERLRHAAPKGSTIARLGGDEFALLLQDSMNSGEASLIASRLLLALRAPYAVGDSEAELSASIGIAFYPDCGAAEKLLSCGDAAMYMAKRAGGATFAFHEPGMGNDTLNQAELLRDLRRAVELRQLELLYQPKIDAASGQLTGVEALVRWNHPTRGVVGPDIFIPLAERTGLILGIGAWVLDAACQQMHEWRSRGVKMRVAVNLSAQQLKQHGLVRRIEQLLQHHGIEPALLTCEVTESAAMTDAREAHRVLTRLGRLGVQVSIDDFGTGYSSLAYLRQLPADELKLDRSFIQDIDTNAEARAIVQAVIQLAHALSLTVVAEGVETAAQRDTLQSLGCDRLQGFLFARPLSAATVSNWALAEHSKPRTFRPSLFLKSLFAPLN